MSLIKAYYVTRASGNAAYTNDGDSFIEIPNFNSYFNSAVAAVGIDPNNGNKVIFAGEFGGVQTIKISTDNGNTLSDPSGGDWTTFNIHVDAADGSRFTVLDSNIFIIHGRDGIYKSTDGGNTFNIVNSSFAGLVSFTIQRSKLWMIDEYNGILGLSSDVSTDPNKLFITSDGGVSWSPIIGYDTASAPNELISAVYMTSDGSVMTVVRYTNILKSTDGGNTWQVAVSFTAPASSTYGAGYHAVNDTVQYALGGNNTTFKTDNSGIGWASQSVDSTVNQSFLFSFYNETEGYTSRFINNENVILRTFDSGTTWTPVDTAGSSVVTLESVLYNCGECPDNFTKSNDTECMGKSLGPNECPQGSTYDPITNTCIGAADCTPTDIVFVLDTGASVNPDEIQQMKNFLAAFIQESNITAGLSNGSIKLGFVRFGGSSPVYPNPISNYALPLTNNITSITNSINSINNVSGGTNTSQGLERGIEVLFDPAYRTPGAIRKLVLVTDGWPASVTDQISGFSESYVISNQGLTSPTLTQTFTVSSDTTPPCNRVPGGNNITDCDRCNIYNTTMEIADYIKNTLGVHITLAILTGDVIGTNTLIDLTTVLTPTENPSQSPTVEGLLTYRALVEGYVDHMTNIFPPSQNSSSPYYVASGYQPPSPVVGGNLGLTGLTNQVTGVPYGRFLFNINSSSYRIGTVPAGDSSTGLPFFTSNGSLSWPALDSIYNNIVYGTSLFDPYRIWNCNEPGDPPNIYAPLCSQNNDGSNDVYVKLFTQAAAVLAPAIAQTICTSASEVVCPEGCTPIPSGTNVRCECEKTLSITPCIFNIYDCSDLTTPVFCTANDISEYIGKDTILSIAIDGEPQPGCYQAQFSTIDYCEPLDFSDVTITETYTSCVECAPSFTRLTSCINEEIYIQVQSDYLTNNIGKAVELFEYPGLCWRIDFEPDIPEILTQVSVKQIYDDCECCKQYSCKN